MFIARRVRVFASVAACFLFLLILGERAAKPALANGEAIPDHYIVVLAPNANATATAHRMERAYRASVSHVYGYALNGFAARIPAARLERLKADPDVLFIEEDRVYTIEAQSVPTGILRIDAELSSTASGNGSGAVNVDVAVIDTGIQTNHPDLNVVGGKNCSTGRSYEDGNGHGTHVAGTIGAKDDNVGVVGVAPGARLWAVRVLNNQGSGTTSTIICGVDWVTQNAGTIEVANMSLGGSGGDSTCLGNDAYHRAICNSVNAGVTYVVAAGNSAADANNFRPATYNEVITVSALADFNGAPGGGAAALYKANNPGATPAQVKAALQNAGTLDWNNGDDHDSTKEKLLNVDGF